MEFAVHDAPSPLSGAITVNPYPSGTPLDQVDPRECETGFTLGFHILQEAGNGIPLRVGAARRARSKFGKGSKAFLVSSWSLLHAIEELAETAGADALLNAGVTGYQ